MSGSCSGRRVTSTRSSPTSKDRSRVFTTMLELTHGYAVVRLTGNEARAVLSKLCPVDLSARAAPNGAALRTSLAGMVVGVVRDDVDDELSFLVYCERSSGQYLFDVLMEAGASSPWTWTVTRKWRFDVPAGQWEARGVTPGMTGNGRMKGV